MSALDKIKKLDNSLHQDVFNILKKYKLNSTKNNNGIFFNMEDINEDIVHELNEYLENSQVSKSIERNDDLNDLNIQNTHVEESNIIPHVIEIKKKSLIEECQQIVDNLQPHVNIVSSNIIYALDKDKQITKKTSVNIFSAAKKKYSKPVLSDSKCANTDILSVDTT